MTVETKTQKESYEMQDWRWRRKDVDYYTDANWIDKIVHFPFLFIGNNLFAGIGIILAILFSFFTSFPLLIGIIAFSVIGIAFQKLFPFEPVAPPFYLSYKHAERYGDGEYWDMEEERRLKMNENNQSGSQQYEETNYQNNDSDVFQKSVDVFNTFDAFSSLMDGDIGAVGDLINGNKRTEGSYGSTYSEQGNQPEFLSIQERQQLYNEAIKDLHNMIGLQEVKKVVSNILKEIKANRVMEKQGMNPDKPTMHMIFSGAPGTGKTETARLLAKILKAIGYLKTGQLVETNRSDLVAEYQGQTAKNVKEKFESALGGILFIDEAYALKNGDNDNFGQEAIDTIIPLMENHRKEMVVILAGYEKDMNNLLKANSGFKSRIAYTFHFTAYTPEQLTDLTVLHLEKRGYIDNNKELIHQSIQLKTSNGVVDGNGRWVRNFVDKIEKEHKVMIADGKVNNVRLIKDEAIKRAIEKME